MLVEIIIGLIVGLALGLTGGGGSIFAVPLLVHVSLLSMNEAVAISLVVVSITSIFGLLLSLRPGLIAWRAGLVFAAGGALSAPLGTLIGNHLSDSVRLVSFAILMIIIGINMWIKATRQPESSSAIRANLRLEGQPGPVCRMRDNEQLRFTAPCAFVLLLTGLAVGVLAGVFGVGGGFLIVPALMVVTQLGAQSAVGTSLLTIGLIGSSGAISSFLQNGNFLQDNVSLTSLFIAGSLLGMLVGRVIARRIAGPSLQKLFATMVVITAAFIVVS